jgi:hypothetical protein
VGPRAGLEVCGKIWPPTGIRSPYLPTRSQSLYRLSYPVPIYCVCTYNNYKNIYIYIVNTQHSVAEVYELSEIYIIFVNIFVIYIELYMVYIIIL